MARPSRTSAWSSTIATVIGCSALTGGKLRTLYKRRLLADTCQFMRVPRVSMAPQAAVERERDVARDEHLAGKLPHPLREIREPPFLRIDRPHDVAHRVDDLARNGGDLAALRADGLRRVDADLPADHFAQNRNLRQART